VGERSETVRGTTLQTPRPLKKEGRRCSKRFPCSPGEDHGEAGCPPAAHGGPRWSRSPPAARGSNPTPKQADAWRKLWPHGEPALEQAPARTRGPMEWGAHAGARLLVGLVTPWGPTGAACSWRTAPHGKGPMLRQFVKDCSPWEGLTLEQFLENCLLGEGPHTGAGAGREEERVADIVCNELTTVKNHTLLQNKTGIISCFSV